MHDPSGDDAISDNIANFRNALKIQLGLELKRSQAPMSFPHRRPRRAAIGELVAIGRGNAGLVGGWEGSCVLPGFQEGVDLVAAALPLLDLKVVADEHIV